MSEVRETWNHFTGPFKAEMKPQSNGYVDVLDGDGNELCTCYCGQTSHNATGITAALNLIFGEEKPESTDEQPDDESKK